MTKFIVHIGDGKCGSTAIQGALWKYRAEAEKLGIFYGTVRPNSNHAGITLFLGHTLRSMNKAIMEEGQSTIKYLRKAAESFEWIIISAESIINYSPHKLYEVLQSISNNVESVNIIAYVREPTSMYLSWVQQSIKGSSTFRPPEKYIIKFDKYLQEWINYFGRDQVSVRLFDKRFLPNGDVVADFSHYVSGVIDRRLKMSVNSRNTSMTAEQMRAMQIFREAHFSDRDGIITPECRMLGRFFERLNAISQIGNRPALSDKAKLVIASNNYRRINHLNMLVPDLNMPTIGSSRDKIHGPFEWHRSKSVSNILKKCNFRIIDHLCRLVRYEEGQPFNYRRPRDVFEELFDKEDSVVAATNAYTILQRNWASISDGHS